MPDPRAETALEATIRSGTSGAVSPDDVLRVLADSEVVVLAPAGTPPTPERLAPLVVHRDDATFIAVFTHVDRVAPQFATGRVPVHIPASLTMRGADPQVGLVINPGSSLGLEVPAAGLAAFRSAVWSASSDTRYFVRQHIQDGELVPFALLRRTVAVGRPTDEVLRDVGVWVPDRNGSVDKAIRMPLDTDLEEVTVAQADAVERMVAARSYRPLSHG